ncbi:putative inactive receptor kinase [Senna tora]|uniref:Putative inactive receptor kinase n=1 Tax=Senna tora TaxID=362788 RepID=A0A834VZH4_9FABA|nr:putative inactive receptor kinase [Senna tora]
MPSSPVLPSTQAQKKSKKLSTGAIIAIACWRNNGSGEEVEGCECDEERIRESKMEVLGKIKHENVLSLGAFYYSKDGMITSATLDLK